MAKPNLNGRGSAVFGVPFDVREAGESAGISNQYHPDTLVLGISCERCHGQPASMWIR